MNPSEQVHLLNLASQYLNHVTHMFLILVLAFFAYSLTKEVIKRFSETMKLSMLPNEVDLVKLIESEVGDTINSSDKKENLALKIRGLPIPIGLYIQIFVPVVIALGFVPLIIAIFIYK